MPALVRHREHVPYVVVLVVQQNVGVARVAAVGEGSAPLSLVFVAVNPAALKA